MPGDMNINTLPQVHLAQKHGISPIGTIAQYVGHSPELSYNNSLIPFSEWFMGVRSYLFY
jgi:hypothetical protein